MKKKKLPKLIGRCPKCGGYIQTGGVRFGCSVPDAWYCVNCGLNSEQEFWWDAQFSVLRPLEKGARK